MPRDASGTYSKPSGTTATPGATITSSQFNSSIDDLVEDANNARPIAAGGTGGTTAATARTQLGVALAQTSVTDTTAGSGLIVGGFGIGGAGVSAGGDLDLAIYSGVYRVTADTTNTPAGTGPTGCSCIVTRWGADDIQQHFTERGANADTVRVYVRQKRAGTWGAWRELAPVTHETNSNGYVTRVGLWQTCISRQLTFTRTDDNTATATWTFPAAFVGSPYIIGLTLCALPLTGGSEYDGITRASIGGISATHDATPTTTTSALRIFNNGVGGAWAGGSSVTGVRVRAEGFWAALA